MADRKAKTSKVSEDPKEIVELDKDERWQARLEEARARREIALREKASNPKKKVRRKPWEEEPGDDPDDFEIRPIVQEKPADEKALDFADRVDTARAAKVATPKPVPVPAPEIKAEPQPPRKSVAKAKPQKEPEFKSRARNFDEIIPPVPAPTVAPAPLPKRSKRRNSDLVAEGAPDVIDLAQRYASTLKPPVNVTQPFDTVPREPAAPSLAEPDVYVAPTPRPRSRRPFGLGLVVLVFALVPLAQVAPPLEKGPAQPPNPFFALPPALGLTTSMVWPVQQTQSGEWTPEAPPRALAALPSFELSPLRSIGPAIGAVQVFDALPVGEVDGAFAWSPPVRPDVMSPALGLGALPVPDDMIQPLAVPAPRPRPTPTVVPTEEAATPTEAPVLQPSDSVPAVESEAEPAPLPNPASGNNNTVVDRLLGLSEDETLANTSPDARPNLGATGPEALPRPSSPLKVTVLVPSTADPVRAAAIASDAEARGHQLTRVREVNVSISEPNVRYFHPEDRAEAARLARAYGAEIKDFTWFRPSPEKGTTEIWLSGSGNRPAARPVPDVRTVDDQPQEPPRTITVIRKQPTFLERLLTGAEDEIEIILPDPSAILEDVQSGTLGNN